MIEATGAPMSKAMMSPVEFNRRRSPPAAISKLANENDMDQAYTVLVPAPAASIDGSCVSSGGTL